MPTFNAIGTIVDSLKVWPENPSFPESLEGGSAVDLAEARNRFAEISQVATELRRLVDRQLVVDLDGAALRYGDSILKAATGGKVVVLDSERWWDLVVKGLKASPNPAGLLSALYSADSVRLTGIPLLAAALGEDSEELRKSLFGKEAAGSPLVVVPIYRAPKYQQRLEEGETTYSRRNRTKAEIVADMEKAAEKARAVFDSTADALTDLAELAKDESPDS